MKTEEHRKGDYHCATLQRGSESAGEYITNNTNIHINEMVKANIHVLELVDHNIVLAII